MIGLRATTLSRGDRVVLRDVDITFSSGTLTAVVGPNGAGKSTLLAAMVGLLPGFARPDPRRVAWVEQGAHCAWGLTVTETVLLGRLPHGDRNPAPVAAAMAVCGITHLASTRVDRISGGEARRAMLARALATQPDILLLDEPTADLDPAAAHAVLATLRALAEAGRTVVTVLHAVDLALQHAHRMVVIAAGGIVADGPPLDILPAAAAAFGLPWGIPRTPGLLPPV